MKILIINQHAGNHGDEAAGKGLLKGLKQKIAFNENKISIIYNKNTINEIERIEKNNEISHYPGTRLSILGKIVAMSTFIFPIKVSRYLFLLSRTLYQEYNLISEADKIISAPGGVNLGPYKDWRYLWRLYVATKLKKDVAIYSISFGPLPSNILFSKSSIYVLKNVNFFSIRDKKSQRIADDIGLNYIPSIDTAFMGYDKPDELPKDIQNMILEDYVVVVPNELYNWGNRNQWHHNFINCNKNDVDQIYIEVINYILKKSLKVVLLPQLYGSQDDISYFKRLKKHINSDKIFIVNEVYDSDIQQTVVSKAKFLVGARYHSIIFALNNKVPFLSLSYEHKMKNTLEILGLEKNNLDLTYLLSNKNINLEAKLEELMLESENLYKKPQSYAAHKIAQETMDKLHIFIGKDSD